MRYFIFDLDGTLVDTEEAILKTWQKTLLDYGYQFLFDELKCVMGVPTETGLKRLHVAVDSSFTAKWHANYEEFVANTCLFDGITEMLDALKEKGCLIGAVSSRSVKEYEKYFKQFHFEKYFNAVIFKEDTEKHKPDPEPVLAYVERVHACKEDCIYIGDMPGDIACANNAEVASGFVCWNGSGVSCDTAVYYFQSPDEILTLAKK